MAKKDGTQISADEAAVLAAGGELQKSATGDPMPKNQAGANGGLSGKAPGTPLSKGKKDEDDDDDDDDEKGDKMEGMKKEGDMEYSKKSLDPADDNSEETASEEALLKAVEHMEIIASGMDTTPDRRAELGEKFSNGTLEKAENDELIELLGGQVPAEEGAQEGAGQTGDLSKSLVDAEGGTEMDVNMFFDKLGSQIDGQLQGVQDELSKSMGNQRSFNVAMAKSFTGLTNLIINQGKLVKSLASDNDALTDRIKTVEETPLPRKGLTGAAPLKKSFEGQGQSDELSRPEIIGGLQQLMTKSRDNEFRAPCGEPVDVAMAKYESSGQITRGMLTNVAEVLGKQVSL